MRRGKLKGEWEAPDGLSLCDVGAGAVTRVLASSELLLGGRALRPIIEWLNYRRRSFCCSSLHAKRLSSPIAAKRWLFGGGCVCRSVVVCRPTGEHSPI